MSSSAWRVRGLPSQRLSAKTSPLCLTNLNRTNCHSRTKLSGCAPIPGDEVGSGHPFSITGCCYPVGEKWERSEEKDPSVHDIDHDGHLLTPPTVSVTPLLFRCPLVLLPWSHSDVIPEGWACSSAPRVPHSITASQPMCLRVSFCRPPVSCFLFPSL